MSKIATLDNNGLRHFGLTTGAIIIVLFGGVLPWIFSSDFPLWPWILGSLLFGVAWLYPIALNPIYFGWMQIGAVLGFINTRIILGLIFYALFVPVGLLLRLLGKDPLNRKLDKHLDSYRMQPLKVNKNHVEKPY